MIADLVVILVKQLKIHKIMSDKMITCALASLKILHRERSVLCVEQSTWDQMFPVYKNWTRFFWHSRNYEAGNLLHCKNGIELPSEAIHAWCVNSFLAKARTYVIKHLTMPIRAIYNTRITKLNVNWQFSVSRHHEIDNTQQWS